MKRAVCLVCGSCYRVSELPGLLKCNKCSFTSADVDLSVDELRRLYTAKYFFGEEYKDYISDRAVIEKQFRLRLHKLLNHTPEPQRSHLFEIGCAYGFFLNVAREHFTTVEGIDISDDAIRYARQNLDLPVLAGDYLTHEHKQAPDVVCLWDTIEHLDRPDLYIEKAAAALKPGGVIAITTGDIGSVVARWRGAKWRQIHPPTHLHYFSRATLEALLNRNSMEVIYRGSDGMYRSVDSMAYIVLAIKRRQQRLYKLLKQTRLLDWNLYLNLHDILFFIARKQG